MKSFDRGIQNIGIGLIQILVQLLFSDVLLQLRQMSQHKIHLGASHLSFCKKRPKIGFYFIFFGEYVSQFFLYFINFSLVVSFFQSHFIIQQLLFVQFSLLITGIQIEQGSFFIQSPFHPFNQHIQFTTTDNGMLHLAVGTDNKKRRIRSRAQLFPHFNAFSLLYVEFHAHKTRIEKVSGCFLRENILCHGFTRCTPSRITIDKNQLFLCLSLNQGLIESQVPELHSTLSKCHTTQ